MTDAQDDEVDPIQVLIAVGAALGGVILGFLIVMIASAPR